MIRKNKDLNNINNQDLTKVYFSIYSELINKQKLEAKKYRKKVLESFNRWIAVRKHEFTVSNGDYSLKKLDFVNYLKDYVDKNKRIN